MMRKTLTFLGVLVGPLALFLGLFFVSVRIQGRTCTGHVELSDLARDVEAATVPARQVARELSTMKKAGDE